MVLRMLEVVSSVIQIYNKRLINSFIWAIKAYPVGMESGTFTI